MGPGGIRGLSADKGDCSSPHTKEIWEIEVFLGSTDIKE